MSDVSFTQTRAASSVSVPSHASMFAGSLPSEHGIHATNVEYERLAEVGTFLDDLPDHETIGVSANPFVSPEFGFGDLFDRFVPVSPYCRYPEGLGVRRYVQKSDHDAPAVYLHFLADALRSDSTTKSVLNGLFSQLKQAIQNRPIHSPFDDGCRIVSRSIRNQVADCHEPFFLFANYMDAHGPLEPLRDYDPTSHDVPADWSSSEYDLAPLLYDESGIAEGYESFIENYRELYGAAIDYLDGRIAALVDWLLDETDRKTTVIVTADHGENLCYEADRSLFEHKSSLTEGLLHVPLELVNPPPGYDATETGYHTHLDLGDLVTGVARGDTPDVFHERINAELVGTPVQRSLFSVEEYRYWHRMIRCAYTETTKVVWDSLDNGTTYELRADRPNWQRPIDECAAVPDWANTVFDTDIETIKQAALQENPHVDTGSIDGDTKDRLEELGYL